MSDGLEKSGHNPVSPVLSLLSVCLSVCLSARLSVCLSVCEAVCLSVFRAVVSEPLGGGGWWAPEVFKPDLLELEVVLGSGGLRTRSLGGLGGGLLGVCDPGFWGLHYHL